MSTIKLIITCFLILLSTFFILIRYVNRILQKNGIKISFSISSLFTLKNLKVNIYHKSLLKLNLNHFEIFCLSISLSFQHWKLTVTLNDCKCSFFVISKMDDKYNHDLKNNVLGNNILNNIDNNNRIGIIRNLMLIVIVQIISRIISIQFENIEIKTKFIDCNCNNNQIIENDKCIRCGMNIKYGLESIINISNLYILTKAYLGGIIINFSIKDSHLLIYPTNKSLSEKRCNAYYLDVNNNIDRYKIKSNIVSYIWNQFNEIKTINMENKTNLFPPMLYIKDNIKINMKLMHSMSGSDIRVCNLRNMNIELDELKMTIIAEIMCELVYIFKSMNFKKNSHKNNIDERRKEYNYKEKSIINENIDEQLKINCKIINPTIIFCDNTTTSCGFELIFNELDTYFTIQYFVEYIKENFNYNDDDTDNDDEHNNNDDLYLNNNGITEYDPNSNELVTNQLLFHSKRYRKNINIVISSKYVICNSLLYINGKRLLTKQIMNNTLIDNDILFDRIFIVDKYKSIIKISEKSSIKFYFKNTIQRMFGIWRENGFYQNLSLFLQLIKFYKYLLKIENDQLNKNKNTENCIDQNDNILNNVDNISNIPERIELEIDDILNNDFIIKDHKYLNELRNNQDIIINLLFYFDIKELTIQTNDIYLFNNEFLNLKKDDFSNNHCEKCFIESFGPVNRYNWCLNQQISENQSDYFILTINNFQLCNTSLNRNFSMLFNNLNLYITDQFIDLEDISVIHLKNFIKNYQTDIHFCIHKYGGFNQKITYFQYNNYQNISKFKKIAQLDKLLINNPWDYKKTSLKFSNIIGDLNLKYVPLYLHLLGCYAVDSLAIKQNNLYKVYYGINNEFQNNFYFYCNKRCDYYNKFNILKNKFIKLIHDINPELLNNNNIKTWNIPDILLSKSGLKYTWYFDFENILLNFHDNFKLSVDKLSFYRCNEYGNYDILINNADIIDSFNKKILTSNSIRLRSDIPYNTIKIKSPLCLKKQLRRLLDLSINGDLFFLSILGDQTNYINNFQDINDGLISFDSKRFILEIEYIKLSLLVDNHLESLFKYLYQYVYITYYQLFHPPLIIRYGKLLSYSKKNPIVFSCNNLFDFVIKKFFVNIYKPNLSNYYTHNQNLFNDLTYLNNKNILYSKDDIIHKYKYKQPKLFYDNNERINQILNKNLLNTLILDFKFDYFKMHIRNKHTNNTKTYCSDKECYNIPNYLVKQSHENNFIINPDYNPFNIFGYFTQIALNLYNPINYYKGQNTIYSRKELNIINKHLIFDLRRHYFKDQNINSELINIFDISIYSKSKTQLNISNIHSYKIIQTLYPIINIIKNHSKLKSNYNIHNPTNNYQNIFINKTQINILINMKQKTLISIIPYVNNDVNIQMDDNSSINIVLPKIYISSKIFKTLDSVDNLLFSLIMKNGFQMYIYSKELFNIKSNSTYFKNISLINSLLNISKLSLNISKSQNSHINVKFLINGFDKELFLKEKSQSNFSKSNDSIIVPLTIDVDFEKFVQLNKIFDNFLNKNNFYDQLVFYCNNCMEFKHFQFKEINNQQINQHNFLFKNQQKFSLNLIINNIHIKYEIFGIIINNSIIFLNYFNNQITKFSLNVNKISLFAECYPYKYKSTKSSKFLYSESKNNIKISSYFSNKTRIIRFIYIGKIIIEFQPEKNMLLLIDVVKLSLNMLSLIYLDIMIKLMNLNLIKSNSNSNKNLNNMNLPKIDKFNIQISNILINIYNSACSEIDMKKNEQLIYSYDYTNYIKRNFLNIDNYDDLLFEILNRSPINHSFILIEEYNESNIFANNIFEIKEDDCIDCIYNLNKTILHSSRIKINHNEDNYKNFSDIIKNYINKYYNNIDNNVNDTRLLYNLYNYYKKATIYNENTYNYSIEYDELIKNIFFDNYNDKYFNLNKNDNYLFKQIILNIEKSDIIFKLIENKKEFELMLKIMPILVNTCISNNLINNFEQFGNNNKNDIKEEGCTLISSNNNTFLNEKLKEENYNNLNLEILKTTPIYINIRILMETSNTYLKLYSNSLIVSIDSNRVKTINEVISSFEYRNLNPKFHLYSTLNNYTNLPSFLTSSNISSFNNNSSNIPLISTIGNNLPPPIYYSHNTNESNNNQLYNQNNTLMKTPSTLSFSSYLNEYKQINFHRIHILNILNIDKKASNYISDLNINKLLINNNDLNDKNVNNILKYEIDKYLINNPLCYTMIDNVQNQVNNENNQIINKLQIECIIDKLNIDMFIFNKKFSNFQSTDINFVLSSNNHNSKLTTIEFDTSSIYLVANKEFFNNNNLITNLNSNSNTIDGNSDEQMSIIYPMYIDGHTNEGHGHVLSIRINMRQVKLLELFNVKILESIIIRVNPIKVNITQYLTSCYYNIFFPSQDYINTINTNLNTNINDNISNNNQSLNDHIDNNSLNLNANTNINISTSNFISTDHQNINSFNINIDNENENNLIFNQSIYTTNSNYFSPKNILYFNYLRISSILVEVTYRGSVSLNKVLLELGSFTQRRKFRTVKEMIDKYISFIRRQAARPVISYTFKQLRHSLLPKQFKSSKRNSNYNNHYNYLYNEANDQNNNKLPNINLNVNSSQNDLLEFNIENDVNCDEKEHSNYFSRGHPNGNSKNDSEYNKFRLLFGNQLFL